MKTENNGFDGPVDHTREGKAVPERLLTAHEAAMFCHVTRRAVLKWIEEGKLSAHRTPGRHVRIEVREFVRFLNKYDLPVPGEFSEYGRKRRILIVDDEAAIVRGIRRALDLESAYEVEFAYNGFSAGLKLNSFNPDVVIVDINMPGMKGEEVIRLIRAKNEAIGIIINSGSITPRIRMEFSGSEGVRFFEKPTDMDALIREIERMCLLRVPGA